ncbi:GNAT family N-acetyltransferase [Antribacter gilvus]|uniref:GNAT family N-acetyltransferase n=1 Tax=Antribacter gilvus TaxID=2304675 RepID=UPI001F0C5496|nr:GNAT family N-acetyltransferase [Antribacter gilvus]
MTEPLTEPLTDPTPAPKPDPVPTAQPAAVTTDRLPGGARGQEVWRTTMGAAGTVTAHVLDPEADADLLHGWFTEPRAAFWGLGNLTPDEVCQTYEFVESLPTHHAYLVRWDGEPVVLLQAYHPEDDPVATAYDVAPGDLGFHFFLGGRGPGTLPAWAVLGPALIEFLFAPDAVIRLVGEPDARNEKAVARVLDLGFDLGERVTFESAYGPKDARIVYLARDKGLALAAAGRAALAKALADVSPTESLRKDAYAN